MQIDGDTAVVAGSLEAARRAAGATVAAVDAVFDGKARSCFVAVRPPGHHAEPNDVRPLHLLKNFPTSCL